MVPPSWGESPCPPREVADSKEGAVSQVPCEGGRQATPHQLVGAQPH